MDSPTRQHDVHALINAFVVVAAGCRRWDEIKGAERLTFMARVRITRDDYGVPLHDALEMNVMHVNY